MHFEEIEIDNFDYGACIDYNNIEKIETLNYGTINYATFFRNYMSKNIPCIIKNVSDQWNCTHLWIQNKKINYNYLIETYKNEIVPVADCEKITFDTQEKDDVNFHTFMQYLKSESKNNMFYLKDWHLRRIRPNDNFYDVPYLFGSDWLNEYAVDNNEDDYMFTYIGPKDSWTPLHADVYSSYSWSVNVIGKKKWILFPPGEEAKLRDNLGNLPLLYDKNKMSIVKHFEVIQDMGDAIFVPSGWHHQVQNLIETISVNHNWINGCNVQCVWRALLESFKSVEIEISELREMSEYGSQCQIILKSLFGMDFESFALFILFIAKKRISKFLDKSCLLFNQYKLGKKHIVFDLKCLLKIIDNIIHHPFYLKKCARNNLETEMITVKSLIIEKLNNI